MTAKKKKKEYIVYLDLAPKTNNKKETAVAGVWENRTQRSLKSDEMVSIKRRKQ